MSQHTGQSSIAVLFALPEERAPFASRKVGGVLLACSGAGPGNAGRAAERTLDNPAVRVLLICGFAGGLSSRTPVGSIVIADSVIGGDALHLAPHPGLLAAARTTGPPLLHTQFGPLLSVRRVLIDPADKRAAACGTGAIAVEMESAAAAAAAVQRGIPWLAVRAITDGVDDRLPLDFNALAGPDGGVDRGRIALAALRRPMAIPGLIRLGRRSASAAGNLAAFLEALIHTISRDCP